ncbi:venom acid phosphatase Acph-1-like [Ostrinia furnacalis]|uniref:venom acid phosphatase Acph-1-like n=1 Tax=Ostrinia furnacalis TaxID=93504 RepID=UPI001038CC84|nr:venom acid phosphatase Acph-1-like [Ostrinia furnacalis]
MKFAIWLLVVLGFVCGEDLSSRQVVEPSNEVETTDELADTDLVLAFVIFRHGDRTPDEEELELYSTDSKYKDVFFPYGMKALTNKGKQRGYLVGQYLRRRYHKFISDLYIPDEIVIRTTDYARTKMTALTALAAMYPPLQPQRWNPVLDWQPIPYSTLDASVDDLLYWYNCPEYLKLRNKVYDYPDFKMLVSPYENLFKYLTTHTGNNITNPEEVFYLDNLFQALENVGLKTPDWAQAVMPQIKEMTKIEYAAEFFTPELTKYSSGLLMAEILNATNAAINGDLDQPKLRLYSAHENNVAALMSAARVFQAHQPNYGATFSVELRKNRKTGRFGVTAVYSANAGGPGEVLPIQGCGDQPICDYSTFVGLMQDILISREEFKQQCPTS